MTSTRATLPRPRLAPPVLVATAAEGTRELVARTLAAGGLANPVVAMSGVAGATAYLGGHGAYADRDTHPAPVVVVTDLHLPGSTGAGGLDVLRTLAGPRHVPVVVVGDGATDLEITEVYRLGAAAYLARPVLATALLDVIRGLNMPWSLSLPYDVA
jgi:DNA-binding NarL/FixJ family response regulator